MTDACLRSRAERERASRLVEVGRLERARRTLRAADAVCPELAHESWLLRLNVLGELGETAELGRVIEEVRASRDVPLPVRDAAAHWAAEVPSNDDPMALVERGRSAEQRHERDAHRYFDRAVVAFERRMGHAVNLDAPNGFWGGVSALAWHGDRLAVSARGVHVLDTGTFTERYELRERGEVTVLAFTDDGRRLIAGTHDDTVFAWDLVDRKQLFTSAYREDAHGVRLLDDAATTLSYQRRGVTFQPLVKAGEESAAGAAGLASGVDGDVAVSPDGRLAAMRNDPNIDVFRVQRYDASAAAPCIVSSSGQPCPPPPPKHPEFTLKSPEGANGSGDVLVFSGDGQRLAALSGDFDVVVFDVSKRKRIATVHHEGTVLALALSRDGKRLASGAADDTARVWDVDTGKELYRLEHRDFVRAVALSPDAARLASGSPDGVLRVSDIDAKRVVFERAPHVPRVDALAFTANGALLTGDSDKTVRIWTDVLGTRLDHRTLKCDVSSAFESFAMSPGNDTLAATTAYSGLCAWSLSTGTLTETRPERSKFTLPSTFGPDRRTVFFAEEDGSVVGQPLGRAGEPSRAQVTDRMGLRSLAVSHDGRTIAAGGFDHVLYLVDARSGEIRQRLQGHRWMVDQVFFTPDDRRILSRGGDVRVWDATSGAMLMPALGSANVIALAPDGATAILAGDESTVLVALANGKTIRSYALGEIRPNVLGFSSDGQWFATASWQRELDVWSVRTGEHLASVRAVQGLDAGYVVTPGGRARFAGKDAEQAKRVASCRFGDVTLEFAVCEDFVSQ